MLATATGAASSPLIRDGARGRGVPSLGDMSPGKSPQKSPTRQSVRSSSRGSAERRDSLSNISDRNDDNDDYGDVGGGDDFMETHDEGDDAASSVSTGRRVSFGDNTKTKKEEEDAASSGQAKRARGRPPARPTKPKTPDSSYTGAGSSTRSTPDSARSARTDLSTPGSDDFPRGRQMRDETFEESGDEKEEGNGGAGSPAVDRTDVQDSDSDSDGADDSGFAHDSFASMKKRKYLDDDEEEEEGEDGDEDDGNRRSRRVTKGKKLAWWKGERPVYDGGRMIGLLTANPTPQKKAKSGGGRLVKGNGNGFSKRVLQGDDEGIMRLVKTEEQLPIVLPEDVVYLARQNADDLLVWDDQTDGLRESKIVCYGETLQVCSLCVFCASLLGVSCMSYTAYGVE